jgi:hypothetical protein
VTLISLYGLVISRGVASGLLRFIAYIEEILAEDIARIYIKEVFIRHGVLIKIILDRDLRFIVAF